MALDLEELKEMHDKAYQYNQTTRERAADDLIFYWITHWDDSSLNDSQLTYRGEFDILRKAGRQILTDLAENNVQVDFEPKDETREDAADVIDGLYRTDDNANSTIESYDIAQQEAVVCGVGAWELYTCYNSLKSDSRNQIIKRRPIHEANNKLFWDPNAKMRDKSDADYCSLLTAYTEDGYKKLVKDLTGESDIDLKAASSFKVPEQSYFFPWIGSEGKIIYITKFYYRELVKDELFTLIDPFKQVIQLRKSTLEEVMDDLIASGFSIISSKEIKRYKITQYIASGLDILTTDTIVGEHIPVVPIFGERQFIEDEEHYEGITKLAKDPARLRDFQLSYLADIVSRSPRSKPIFWPEQIKGHEKMYSESGADNNYPYLLQNRKALDGTDLPIGPVAVMPEQPIPSALVQSIQLTRQAIEDVANPGVPQDIADPDISGKAVLALQARIDMQSVVYQRGKKHAKRRDGEIYASMASETYDVPRKVTLTKPDGTKQDIQIMQFITDKQTGESVIINDITNSEFEVTSTIGPSYTSQKEQVLDRLDQMIHNMDPADPTKRIILLKILKLMDGVEFDDIRDYANRQLIIAGVKKPETPEEQKMYLEAMKKQNEPSAEMILAQAEMLKGKAAIEKEKRELKKQEYDIRNEMAKRGIEGFEAETGRAAVQIDAAEAGVNIDYKRIDSFGKQLENLEKLLKLAINSNNKPVKIPEDDFSMKSDNELLQVLATG